MMNSLELVRRLYHNGTFTKEAALGVLRGRELLIKRALAVEADRLWANLASLSKTAGWLGSSGGGEPGRWNDVSGNLLKMMGVAALSAGATAGTSAFLRHRRDRTRSGEIERSYEQMFKQHKELQGLPPDKMERVKTHFGVLARFAPSLAADPTVAGSFVRGTAEMGIIEPKTIQTLAETQRRIDELHESQTPFADHLGRNLSWAHKAIPQRK